MADGGDRRTDEDLMRAFVGGDHGAFRVLFDRYAPMLLRVARRRLSSDEEAREVVQQTFFQLNLARNDFREDAKLRPWVVTIAMNLVREHYRRRGRRKEAPIDAAIHTVGVEPKSEIESEQRAQRVRAAIASLPETQRIVIELHWLEELPFSEVARIVGAREGAVRVRAHRGYKRLEELLEKELGSE
jgi:RNA polymerase sigma-70 factor (ECF subfamily)